MKRLTLATLLVCAVLTSPVWCYARVPVIDTYNVVDSFDSARPLEIPIYIDDGLQLYDIRVTIMGMRYRTHAAVDTADCTHAHIVEAPGHVHQLGGAMQGTFTDMTLTNISISDHAMGDGERIRHAVTDPGHRHYFEYLYPYEMSAEGGGYYETSLAELLHSHGLIYGIYEDLSADGLPKGVDLWFCNSEDRNGYVHVADLTEPSPRVDEFELCENLSLNAEGSGWKWIRLTTTTRGRVSVHLVIRGWVTDWTE
ncbi:MAG: hypothetical protein WBH35_04305 [Bacillota bacterium]|jgi:hypothetical protein